MFENLIVEALHISPMIPALLVASLLVPMGSMMIILAILPSHPLAPVSTLIITPGHSRRTSALTCLGKPWSDDPVLNTTYSSPYAQ